LNGPPALPRCGTSLADESNGLHWDQNNAAQARPAISIGNPPGRPDRDVERRDVPAHSPEMVVPHGLASWR
jgi:hypothetical protein